MVYVTRKGGDGPDILFPDGRLADAESPDTAGGFLEPIQELIVVGCKALVDSDVDAGVGG